MVYGRLQSGHWYAGRSSAVDSCRALGDGRNGGRGLAVGCHRALHSPVNFAGGTVKTNVVEAGKRRTLDGTDGVIRNKKLFLLIATSARENNHG